MIPQTPTIKTKILQTSLSSSPAHQPLHGFQSYWHMDLTGSHKMPWQPATSSPYWAAFWTPADRGRGTRSPSRGSPGPRPRGWRGTAWPASNTATACRGLGRAAVCREPAPPRAESFLHRCGGPPSLWGFLGFPVRTFLCYSLVCTLRSFPWMAVASCCSLPFSSSI